MQEDALCAVVCDCKRARAGTTNPKGTQHHWKRWDFLLHFG